MGMPHLTARPSIRLLCATAFLGAGLAATSCDSAEQPAAPSNAIPTITITADGISQNVPLLYPGSPVRIVNTDTRAHRLHLDVGDDQPGCQALDVSGEVAPGESLLTGPLGLDVVSCAVHDHMTHGDSRFAVRLIVDDGQ
jgi:hypothetical protein